MSSLDSRLRPTSGWLGVVCLLLGGAGAVASPPPTLTRFDLGTGLSVDAISADQLGNVFVSSSLANTFTWVDNQYGVHNFTLPTSNSLPGPIAKYCGGALVTLANLDRFATFSYLPRGSSHFTQTPQINVTGFLGDIAPAKGSLIYAAVNDPTNGIGSVLGYDVKMNSGVTYNFGAKSINGLSYDWKNKLVFGSDPISSSIYRLDFSAGTTPTVLQYQFPPGTFGTDSGDFARGCSGETYFTANKAVYRMITTAGTTSFDYVSFTNVSPSGLMVRHEDCNIYLTLNGAQNWIGELRFPATPSDSTFFTYLVQSDVFLGYIGAIKRPETPYVPLRGLSNFATDPASICPSLDFAVQGNNTTTHGDDLYWFKWPQTSCPPPQETGAPREPLPVLGLRYSF